MLRSSAAKGPSADWAHQGVQAWFWGRSQPVGSHSVPLAHSLHSWPRGHHTGRNPGSKVSASFSFLPLYWISKFFQIVLPPHLERIREKLAENSHELWAVTRIEQGWTFGPVSVCSASRRKWGCVLPSDFCIFINFFKSFCKFRDDNKKLHPCLVDFQSLPEPEKNYNLAMSGETLK